MIKFIIALSIIFSSPKLFGSNENRIQLNNEIPEVLILEYRFWGRLTFDKGNYLSKIGYLRGEITHWLKAPFQRKLFKGTKPRTLAFAISKLDGGGSSTDTYLHLFDISKKEPKNLITFFLGDRTPILDFRFINFKLEVETAGLNPGDGLCCPSKRVKTTYIIDEPYLIAQKSFIYGHIE